MRNWEPRAITSDEVDMFRTRVAQGFGSDTSDEDGARERFDRIFELERTVAVFDEDNMVGTGGAFSYELTVPGGTMPMGGTTIITVRPTHRRQGVLRAMMDYHLAEVAGKGEPIAGLWASEGTIYGRFGYGLAVEGVDLKVNTSGFAMNDLGSGLEVHLLEPGSEHEVRSVYESARSVTPGMLSRTDGWWDNRVFGPDNPSGGFSKRRVAIALDGGDPVAYAIFRQKTNWAGADGPEGELRITELVSRTDAGRGAIWRFLCNVDLFETVTWWNMPVDDPISAMVEDWRTIKGRRKDTLWIRLLDIAAALSGRSYEADGSVSIGVTDPFRPDNDGTYELEVRDGVGVCSRSDDTADVTCEVDVLGHMFLGGGNALTMARAGRLKGSTEQVQLVHRMFSTAKAPWCPEVF